MESDEPTRIGRELREREFDALVVRVEQDQEVAVHDAPPALVGLEQAFAGEVHAQTASEVLLPLLLGHLRPVGLEPRDILYVGSAQRSAFEKMPPAQYRMLA